MFLLLIIRTQKVAFISWTQDAFPFIWLIGLMPISHIHFKNIGYLIQYGDRWLHFIANIQIDRIKALVQPMLQFRFGDTFRFQKFLYPIHGTFLVVCCKGTQFKWVNGMNRVFFPSLCTSVVPQINKVLIPNAPKQFPDNWYSLIEIRP